ncbi:MAG: TolC family protein [Bacteroidaceae bacterium]|nr:TolC family protein [Bacteroidaceae bacterium]
MKKVLLILLVAMSVSGVAAQSLDECRRLAREHYPEIRQYDLISQTEQYNLSNAVRAWIPQVALSAQVTYQSATPAYPDAFNAILQANGMEMDGVRKDQYKIAVDVSQNIWDGGLSKANRLMAEAEAEEQRRCVDVSVYALQSRIDNIYFGILLLDERVSQTEMLISVLESNLSRMRAYCENGVARQVDADVVEAELLSARQTLAQVLSSRASYRRMLELFIGYTLSDDKLERPVMRDLPPFTPARPELAMFSAQENRLSAQRKAINTSVMPRLSAFAQGYYGYPGLDMFKSMVSSDWSFNAIVGVRMSWNIGAFYTKKNNLDKLDLAQKQLDVQRDVFLFNTQMQIVQDEGEITRLRHAVDEDERIVELRRRVRVAAESQLENGVIDATDLLRKIADERDAALAQSVHEIELLQAVYRLKTTLNQ